MADNTPTLMEIEGGQVDSSIATGNPAVVYDNSQLLNILNQNAQFKAANDWRKYQQFLGDYETRVKTQQDIADMAVADSDRDWLKKESVNLFKDALSDPYKIYSPEFNSKLANLKANAVSSKQARDFAEKNAQWITLHPEFNTDENKAKITDFIEGQTVEGGGRKMFTLDLPDVFDTQNYFKGLKGATAETVDASGISPDGKLIIERQDTNYKYKPFLELIKSGYDSTPQIKAKAKRDFESLPPEIKRNFEDPKDYWVNFGSKHFGAYDDITVQGKPDIKENPNYLEAEKLAQKEKESKRDNDTRRYIASIGKGTGKTPQQVIDEMGNALDSFPKWEGESGAYNDPTTGLYYDKDGKLLTNEKGIRLNKTEIPDGIINLIQQANPQFNAAKAATLIVRNGRVEEIKFDGQPVITRNNILNYQVNEVSKFTEKGNPYLPYYGAKGGKHPTITNDASYYTNESNVVSSNGNEFTYKDGTVMIYDSKTGKLVPKK